MPDAAISDSLFDQYPLPPMPEAQPSDLLGAFFGAAPDRTKSYAAGLDAGSQYRLRSAQGEKALEEAHMQREQRMGEEMANNLRRKVQADPNYQPTVSEMLLISKNANDFTQARGGFQEQGYQAGMVDPNTSPEQRFRYGEALQKRALPQVQAMGPGREINMLTQTPSTNPIGEAAIAGKDAQAGAAGALTDLRDRTDPNLRATPAPGAGGAGGAAPKPLNQFQVKALGQLSRMDRTEAILAKDYANYTPDLADVALDKVPLGGNYMSSEKFQKYKQAANEWISGLLRLDSGAAVPETEFKRYFDTFFPQPGQDEEVIAQKAAARAAAANALRAGLPPEAVLAAAAGSNPGAPPPAPAASGPPSPKTQAEYNALASGTVYIDTDGQRKRKK